MEMVVDFSTIELELTQKNIPKLELPYYRDVEIRIILRSKNYLEIGAYQEMYIDSNVNIKQLIPYYNKWIRPESISGLKINSRDNSNRIKLLHGNFEGIIRFHIRNETNQYFPINEGTILGLLIFSPFCTTM